MEAAVTVPSVSKKGRTRFYNVTVGGAVVNRRYNDFKTLYSGAGEKLR